MPPRPNGHRRHQRRRAPSIPLDLIKQKLDERCEDLARKYLGQPNNPKATTEWRWGRKSEISLIIATGHSRRGQWYDHYGTHAIEGGKGLEMIMRWGGFIELPDAINEAIVFLGLDPHAIARQGRPTAPLAPRPKPPSEAERSDDAKKLAYATRIWDAGAAARDGDPLHLYLSRRNILRPWANVRLSNHVFDPEQDCRRIAAVAAIRATPNGPLRSAQAVYLTPDGDQAELEVPKRTWHRTRGEVCWLLERECAIALIAEGWENSASAFLMVDEPDDVVPAGACGGGAFMAWQPPPWVKAALVIGDNDLLDRINRRNNGRRQATRLTDRLESEGLPTELWFPVHRGVDANDLRRAGRRPRSLFDALDRLRRRLAAGPVAEQRQGQPAQARPEPRDTNPIAPASGGRFRSRRDDRRQSA
jgi:hypothetical protein